MDQQQRPEPIRSRIASHFRDKIMAGELGSGAKLPSMSQICEEWQVSETTARAVLLQLQSEGLIQTRRGSGAYVRRVKPLVRLAPERYFRPHQRITYLEEAERAGREVDAQHDTVRVEAPSHIADRLGIGEGDPVIRTSYLIRMDGQPVTSSLAWEPYAIVGGTPIERPHEGPMAGRGIVPRFDSIGLYVDEVEEIVNCRTPAPAEATALDITTAVPVIEITQTFRAAGTAVETADIVFPSDRYELHYRMQIPVETGFEPEPRDPADIMGWGLGH